jgi:hypothetical protein
VFFSAVGEKAEVTDAHEAIGEHVKQEAADKFLGFKDHRLFPIAIFAISVAQQDFSVIDLQDAVIAQSDTVRVAAEVVENGAGRAEGFFRIDDPAFLA